MKKTLILILLVGVFISSAQAKDLTSALRLPYPSLGQSGSAVITTNTQYVFTGGRLAVQNVGAGDNLIYNVFGVTASITALNGSKYIAQGAERLFPGQVTTINFGPATEGSPVTFSYTAYGSGR